MAQSKQPVETALFLLGVYIKATSTFNSYDLSCGLRGLLRTEHVALDYTTQEEREQRPGPIV